MHPLTVSVLFYDRQATLADRLIRMLGGVKHTHVAIRGSYRPCCGRRAAQVGYSYSV